MSRRRRAERPERYPLALAALFLLVIGALLGVRVDVPEALYGGLAASLAAGLAMADPRRLYSDSPQEH
jgi:hypothetical protein